MIKKPEDLKVKIGSHMEVVWTNVQKNIKSSIETMEDELIVNKALLALAEQRIKEEQERFK